MRLRSSAMELARKKTEEAAFEARIERDIAEGSQWIQANLGVQAEFTGRVQQKDSFNPGGVVFKLVDDEGYHVADNFSGRMVPNPEHREALSRGVYVSDTGDNSEPYVVMSIYAPDEEKFAGTKNVRDAVDFQRTLNTTLHQRGPNDPAYVWRTPRS